MIGIYASLISNNIKSTRLIGFLATHNDAPLNSFMDSTMSLKVKITEGEGVGACSLVRNTSGVERCVGILGWD
jgi:hypothetical protein